MRLRFWRRARREYMPGPFAKMMDEEIRRMRHTVGMGRCAECNELATPEHSGLAHGGSVRAGCPNGHRWTVTLTPQSIR